MRKEKSRIMKKTYYLFQMKTELLNILSLVLIIIMFIVLYLIYGSRIINVFNEGFAMTFILMMPYFALHEVFHSTAYVIHGANFKNITYGAHLEKGVLCCLCKQNITKKNILISLLYPFLFLGIITLIIGIVFKIYPLVLLSLMNISGCTGDFIMFYNLVKIPDFEFSEFDNPIAFALLSDKDLSKLKLPGLLYLDKTDKLERTINKKIDISKSSIIYLLIFIAIGIINLFL